MLGPKARGQHQLQHLSSITDDATPMTHQDLLQSPVNLIVPEPLDQ